MYSSAFNVSLAHYYNDTGLLVKTKCWKYSTGQAASVQRETGLKFLQDDFPLEMTTDLMLFPTFCVLILASYQVQLSSFAITIPTASNKWIYLSGEEKTGQKHCVHKLAQKGIRLQETPGQASPPLNPGFCSPNPECSRFPCSNSPTARLQLPESTGATAHPQKPPRPWVDLHQAKKMAAPARLCLKVKEERVFNSIDFNVLSK